MSFNLDDYEHVATRLARWLEDVTKHHETPRVVTEMIHRGDDWCVFKAELHTVDQNGRDLLIATGWAEEHVTERGVNQTSHVENCETSAVGRALANAGFAGSDPSRRASREEMSKVQRAGGQPQQYSSRPSGLATEKQKQFIRDLCAKKNLEVAMAADLSFADASELIEALKGGKVPPRFMTDLGDEEPF